MFAIVRVYRFGISGRATRLLDRMEDTLRVHAPGNPRNKSETKKGRLVQRWQECLRRDDDEVFGRGADVKLAPTASRT